ncbi:MAG: OmpH family outer membrane protein [Bacteroidales bacterium]|nr:OmpH family outer membrane protein [Bacteroidales bacterium]
MKKLTLLLAVLLFAGVAETNAQSVKFGHINTQEVIVLTADYDSARVRINAYSKDLQEEMETMYTEYTNKVNTFQQKQATWTEAIRAAKETELQELQQRLAQFQQTAEQDIAQFQQNQMLPIFEKAKAAVEKIAKEKNLLFVFELSANPVAYFNEQQSVNLLPLVKAELGVPAEKVAPTIIQ